MFLSKVYDSLSSERLLVMERFRGVPLTDLDGIRSCSSNPEATLITALNTWSMSVMMAESFHAVRQASVSIFVVVVVVCFLSYFFAVFAVFCCFPFTFLSVTAVCTLGAVLLFIIVLWVAVM